MSEFEGHTPGPWMVGYQAMDVQAPSKKGGTFKVCDIRGWGYLTGGGLGALGLPHETAIAIQTANARLIAAAPTLLREKVCDIRGWGYLTGGGLGALGLPHETAIAIQTANARLIAAAPTLLREKVCDIRGWGYLTGGGLGALGLPHETAIAIQTANARLIAAAPTLLRERDEARAESARLSARVAELEGLLRQWSAVDAGSWAVDWHARKKAALDDMTNDALSHAKGGE